MASSDKTIGQWSPWFNSDRPWLGSGDVETLKSIEHHYGPVCSFRETIEATQCQLTKHGQEFTDITAHTLKDNLKIPCTDKGLLCLNSQQDAGMCHDYAVRFLCAVSNDSKVNEDDNSDYFPQFDARIYIILAVVPILVFLLRILWGFVFRRRRHQRRRRDRRNRNGGNDDDDDSSSIASSLANAPPSYHQLFGELGTNRANGGSSSIFAITRSTISVCQGCKETKCSVAKALSLCHHTTITAQNSTSNSNIINSNSSSQQQGCSSSSSNNNSSSSSGSSSNNSTIVIPVSENTQQSILQHSVRIEGGIGSLSAACNTQQDTTQQPAHDQPSTSVDVEPKHSSSGSQNTTTPNPSEPQTSPQTCTLQVEPEVSATTTTTTSFVVSVPMDSIDPSELISQISQTQSSSSNNNNTNSSRRVEEILLTPSNTPNISNIISQPCPCACHRTVAISTTRGRSISTSGFDNGGFSGEGVQIVPHPASSDVPTTLHRVYSNLSNGSVITLSELPSYEDALDLLKKKDPTIAE